MAVARVRTGNHFFLDRLYTFLSMTTEPLCNMSSFFSFPYGTNLYRNVLMQKNCVDCGDLVFIQTQALFHSEPMFLGFGRSFTTFNYFVPHHVPRFSFYTAEAIDWHSQSDDAGRSHAYTFATLRSLYLKPRCGRSGTGVLVWQALLGACHLPRQRGCRHASNFGSSKQTNKHTYHCVSQRCRKTNFLVSKLALHVYCTKYTQMTTQHS